MSRSMVVKKYPETGVGVSMGMQRVVMVAILLLSFKEIEHSKGRYCDVLTSLK